MPPASPTTSRPRRRWFRYSLRTFLLAITLLCCWLGIQANRAHNTARGISRVKELQGRTRFDYQREKDAWGDSTEAEPWAPYWLRDLLGDNWFHNIVDVHDLSDLQNDDLRFCHDLPNLTQLELSRNRAVTDDGLRYLAGLDSLQFLWLDHTSVTGPGFRHLSNLKKLEILCARHTPLTDEALRHLTSLPRLRRLMLPGTKLTDAGMKSLAQIQSLEEIDLRETEVTDAGLQELHALQHLTLAALSSPHVTDEGIAKFKAAHPKCRIEISRN